MIERMSPTRSTTPFFVTVHPENATVATVERIVNMDNTKPTPSTDQQAIAEEARDLSEWMRAPTPETDTKRQAREASMRSMATRLMGGDKTT